MITVNVVYTCVKSPGHRRYRLMKEGRTVATIAQPRPDRSANIKERIRASAKLLFADNGFESTGIRDIAAEAGVNPAIVIRHFGSKERLFVATIDAQRGWEAALDGPVEEIGERMVRAVLAGKKNGLHVFGGVVRATGRPDIRAHLQQLIVTQFAAPLAKRLGGDALRAHLLAAQLTGLMFALSVYDDEFLIATDDEIILESYGRILQQTATGSIGV